MVHSSVSWYGGYLTIGHALLQKVIYFKVHSHYSSHVAFHTGTCWCIRTKKTAFMHANLLSQRKIVASYLFPFIYLFIYFQFQASNHGTVYEYAFRRRPAQQKLILKEQSETECKFAYPGCQRFFSPSATEYCEAARETSDTGC